MKLKYSLNELDKLISDLQDYSNDLDNKCAVFVSKLMDLGVEAAVDNSGQYRGLIRFEKHLFSDANGCDGIILATDGTKLIRQWLYKGGIKSVEISPLLMAEFGSGWLANVIGNVNGVGQGTFPNQKHAFDEGGWSWTTPDGEKHHSMGETPTYPMHNAVVKMLNEINRVGKEVFKNG